MKIYILIPYLIFVYIESTICQSGIQNKIEIDEIFTIGTNMSSDVNYMFGSPKFINVDHEGTIYVAEQTDLSIRIYNSMGNFISRFGRRGRGPNEYLDFSYVKLIDSLLFIFDMMNARITVFNTSDSTSYFLPIDFNKLLWPKGLIRNENEYIALSNVQYKDELFFSFNSKFDVIDQEFGEQLYPGNEVEEAILSFFDSQVLKISNNCFLYTPAYYNGKIYRFIMEEGHWNLSKEHLHGFINSQPAFVEIKDRNSDKNDISFTAHIEGTTVRAKFRNESRGLFKLNNGYLIHFTLITQNKFRIFGFELYDLKYNFNGYYEIARKQILGENVTDIALKAVGVDYKNNVYFLDTSDLPIIKKVSITVLKNL